MVRDNLIRHIGVPDTPSGRSEKPSIMLDDYEALYLQRQLRMYAEYEARGTTEDIARGYVTMIDEVIRDRGQRYINLYVGTEITFTTLLEALEYSDSPIQELSTGLYERVMDTYDGAYLFGEEA